MSRARTQLLRSLGALLVARSDPGHCDELTELIRGWNGQSSLRCCASGSAATLSGAPGAPSRQAQLLNPAHLLPAYAALPFLAVPAVVWPRLAPGRTARSSAARISAPGPTPGPQPPGTAPAGPPPATVGRAPVPAPAGPGPLPVSPITARRRHDPEPDRRPLLVVAVALLVLMVLGAGVGLGLARLNPAGDPSQASTDRPEPGLTPGGGGPAEPTPTAFDDPGHHRPALAGPPTPPPTSLAPLVFTASTMFTVTADGDPVCVATCVINGSRIDVTAQANATLDRVLLYWTAPLDRDPMAVTGAQVGQRQHRRHHRQRGHLVGRGRGRGRSRGRDAPR